MYNFSQSTLLSTIPWICPICPGLNSADPSSCSGRAFSSYFKAIARSSLRPTRAAAQTYLSLALATSVFFVKAGRVGGGTFISAIASFGDASDGLDLRTG